jgi:hypothetical protein
MRYIISKHVEFALEQWENNPGAAMQANPCTNRGYEIGHHFLLACETSLVKYWK